VAPVVGEGEDIMMRLGMFLGENAPNDRTLAELAEQATWMERKGFDHAWLPYVPWSFDPFVALTVVAAATSTIELGTAVVPTYPFHPMAMARSALTVQAASGNRLSLGIGPSHPSVIEGMYGYSYARPRAHTAEYLGALQRAFALDGRAEAHGDFFDYGGMFSVPNPHTLRSPGVLIAALAPKMLQLAGEHADGTLLWLADETALATHAIPLITRAAAEAGRPTPRIVSCMPVAVCDDEAAGREHAATMYAAYRSIPTYQRILGAGASSNPEDVVLVGPIDSIRARLERWQELGVSDVVFSPFPLPGNRRESLTRTREELASLCSS
jgi:5,10-methylenetetrahydromethanopterin reductase